MSTSSVTNPSVLLMFGLAGIFVEVMKDISFGITHITKRDAHEKELEKNLSDKLKL